MKNRITQMVVALLVVGVASLASAQKVRKAPDAKDKKVVQLFCPDLTVALRALSVCTIQFSLYTLVCQSNFN